MPAMVCALVEKKVEMPLTNAVPNVPHDVVPSTRLFAISIADPVSDVSDVPIDPVPPPRLPPNGEAEILVKNGIGKATPRPEPVAEVKLVIIEPPALVVSPNILNSPSNLFIFCF